MSILFKSNKKAKIFYLGCLTTLSCAIVILFSIGPSYIEKERNSIYSLTLEFPSAASKAFHESLTIADLHADSLLWKRNLYEHKNYAHVDIPRLIEGNVSLQVFTVVTKVPDTPLIQGNDSDSDSITKLAILQLWPISTWSSLKERALYQANKLHNLEHKVPHKFKIIKTAHDLNKYLKLRQNTPQITAGLLGLEGAHALEGNIKNIDLFYAAGFRIIGLVHAFDNDIGGSVHGIDRSGLTPFGRDVVRRIENLSMIIDLAHASPQTIDDVLQITERPLIVSHTGVKGTCNNARNLSDRQLKQIADSRGLIGIGFWETATCGKDVDSIVRAIQYTVDLVGVEHVALGSDFDGSVHVPFTASEINQITYALQKKGYGKTDIEKIMGLNVIRLLKDLLPD